MRDHDEDLEGFTQAERAEFARLTNIEAEKSPPVPLTGPVEALGLLRRRESTDALLAQTLGPSAFVVRLDDGFVTSRVEGLAALTCVELADFTAKLGGLQVAVADEQRRRAVDR
jgi:hypothetical protein